MILGEIARRGEKFLIDNSPAVLTAIGVTGALTTAILTGTASYRAAELIGELEDDVREGQRRNLIPDVSTREKVELVWKLYIPAIGTGVITIAAIVMSNRISSRRAAALAAAYSITEKAFEEYKEKVVEKIGTTKEQKVRDEIMQDRVNAYPCDEDSAEIVIVAGDVLCYEAFTGRYFNSNMENLRKAVNDLNYQVLNQNYASLTDFYNLIGLPTTAYSDEVGWNVDKQLELQYSTVLSEDGRPCLAINFTVSPIRGYYRLQ